MIHTCACCGVSSYLADSYSGVRYMNTCAELVLESRCITRVGYELESAGFGAPPNFQHGAPRGLYDMQLTCLMGNLLISMTTEPYCLPVDSMRWREGSSAMIL